MRITGPITGTRWASAVGTLAFGRSWPCRNGASSRLAAKGASNPSMSVIDRVCGCEVACARVQLLSYVRGWCDEMRMYMATLAMCLSRVLERRLHLMHSCLEFMASNVYFDSCLLRFVMVDVDVRFLCATFPLPICRFDSLMGGGGGAEDEEYLNDLLLIDTTSFRVGARIRCYECISLHLLLFFSLMIFSKGSLVAHLRVCGLHTCAYMCPLQLHVCSGDQAGRERHPPSRAQ